MNNVLLNLILENYQNDSILGNIYDILSDSNYIPDDFSVYGLKTSASLLDGIHDLIFIVRVPKEKKYSELDRSFATQELTRLLSPNIVVVHTDEQLLSMKNEHMLTQDQYTHIQAEKLHIKDILEPSQKKTETASERHDESGDEKDDNEKKKSSSYSSPDSSYSEDGNTGQESGSTNSPDSSGFRKS